MISKICLYFLYLNTELTEHEIYFFLLQENTSSVITCNNYLVTVVDLNYFDQTMNLSWGEEICDIDIDNNFKSGSRK